MDRVQLPLIRRETFAAIVRGEWGLINNKRDRTIYDLSFFFINGFLWKRTMRPIVLSPGFLSFPAPVFAVIKI